MARRTKKNVGVIGLGIIGSRVTDNLRRKGFHVFVWNRSPRPVPNFVGAPAELAEMCDYMQIFVSDDDALLEVVKQMAPALAPRHIVLAHPTVAPHSMREAADIVERRGARFIEAPFTGSKLGAEKGELVFYVAGDEVALREARPILEASAKEIIEIGEIGQATIIKLATNIVTAASVQAVAEALALIYNAGISADKLTAAMQGNASNSGTISMKLPKMIAGDFEPYFSVKHMLKDMQIASRVGLAHHLELAVTAAARDRLLEQDQRGHGDEDFSAVVRKYFPEVRPASREEAELELFENTGGGVAPLASALMEEEVPPQVQSLEMSPAADETPPAESKPEPQPTEPIASVNPPAHLEKPEPEKPNAIPAEATAQASAETVVEQNIVSAETTAPAPREEPLEEQAPHRSLLDRFLHRETGSEGDY
jgi:3-hydroxyisobutyrate dehydrogenase-like beta-hydroxyacid dehydrogenase